MFITKLRLFESKTNSVDLKETAWTLRIVERLANAHARESKTIALLSSRLKLTSLYDKANAHQARRAFLADQKPWDIPAEPDVDLN